VFTKKNYEKKLNQLLQILDICFGNIKSIIFATGIYELTYYLTESKKQLIEFDQKFLRKFPVVFLHASRKWYDGQQIYIDASIKCIYNKDAQTIFEEI
jgi:hypothetical protein